MNLKFIIEKWRKNMKKFISILIVFIMVLSSISIYVSAAENVEYYPECPLLPTYESLGYWSSREILDKGDGRKAYIMSIYKPDVYAVEYEQRLKSEFGWTEVSSTDSYNTNYKVFKKEDYYVGIAIVYNSSSADNIRIYPDLEDPTDTTDPYLAYLHKQPSVKPVKKDEEISVVVDGNKINFDVQPMMINDRVLVPMRMIFERLGAKVSWDDYTETVTATKDNDVISLSINSNKLIKNGNTIIIDTPARLENDRTLVPVRAISEALNCNVQWNEATNTVIIISRLPVNKNTNNNLANGGYYAYSNGWVYCSQNSGLYKMKPDGSSKTLITDEYCTNINVVDEWIYYISKEKITKIKTNGTQKTVLNWTDRAERCLVISNNIVYYIDIWGGLFKINLDGTNPKRIGDINTYFFQVDGDWIYYNQEITPSGIGSGNIYRIKTDGTQQSKLVDCNTSDFNVCNGWIYYENHEYHNTGIFKVKIDGSEKQCIINEEDVYNFTIVNNNIVFFKYYDLFSKPIQGDIYMTDLNGGNRIFVKQFTGSPFYLGAAEQSVYCTLAKGVGDYVYDIIDLASVKSADNKLIEVSNININPNSVSLAEGEEVSLSLNITPSNATDKSVVWESSNNKVAAVDNGKVVAYKAGTAIITAKSSNGLVGKCTVTVQGTLWYSDDMYRVGIDISAGDYYAVTDSEYGGYYCKYTDSTQDDIEDNDSFNNFTFFRCYDGQYLKLSRCKITPIENAPVYTPDNGIYSEGTYRVGIDMPAGEYKFTATDNKYRGYYCAYTDITYEDIEDNEIFEKASYYKVRNGQYLKIDRAEAIMVKDVSENKNYKNNDYFSNSAQNDNSFDIFASYIKENGVYKKDDGRYCITYKISIDNADIKLYCQHSPTEGTIQIQSACVDDDYNVTTQIFTIYEIGKTYKSSCIMIIPGGTLTVNANEKPENVRKNYMSTISSYDFEKSDGTKLTGNKKEEFRDTAISAISKSSVFTVTLLKKYLSENRSIGLSIADLGFVNF